MKRLFLTFATLSAVVVLGMGCATTKQEKSQPAAGVSSTPSTTSPAVTPAQPEIVTPPVTLPPEQQPSPSSK